MRTRKKVNGRTCRELASPKVSRHQKRVSEIAHAQAKEAADFITSSARKQNSDLDNRVPSFDDDASIEWLEQDAEHGGNGIPVDNKGYDAESAPQETESIFSPAFHLSRNAGVTVGDVCEFQHYDDCDQGNMQFLSSHAFQEDSHENMRSSRNIPTTGGGDSLSSEASDMYISMRNENFECVDECNQDHMSANVEVKYEELDDFDPYFFIKNLPDLSAVVPAHRPVLLPKQTRSCPPTTLVLDLDETLVHSTLEPCQDADFTFHVNYNQQQHAVHVRCRPHLRDFLERVSGLFEIIIFTASQSIYANQLLNKLDQKRKIFRHRVFRESCVLVDGNYLKDLSILGRDLSHVIIVDNSPQAFGFQVDNGIPIESWFDDDSDKELLLLLPFLESLVGVDDVRPLIANKYNLRQKISAAICPYTSSYSYRGDVLQR